MSPARQPLSRPRRRLAVVGAVCLLSAGFAACGGSDTPIPPKLSQAAVDAALATTPAGLTDAEKALEQGAGTLLPGDGDDAGRQLDAQVRALRGTPVVVNLWGDWCVPCRKEIPVLQRATLQLRGKVAFIGVATRTTRSKTDAFLKDEFALPYPSIFDPDEQVNDRAGVKSIPKTLFYKPSGGAPFVHLGVYRSVAELEQDIAEYAS